MTDTYSNFLQDHPHGRRPLTSHSWPIPKRGRKDVLLRVKDEIHKDNLSIAAAGLAFYGMFAVFPAITAFVTL